MVKRYRFSKKIMFVCFVMFPLLFLLDTLISVSHLTISNAFGDSSIKSTTSNKKDSLSTYIVLDNGMEFVLIENHANPMIASVVMVKAGSRNEDLNNNGVSHMLEHLLFNGTKNRTQEDIYGQMDFYGGYNNAHTAKDYTNFMILLPAEHIDKGLDIQADMLFNSTIPEEKLEKEKGIVIEEIGKDMDKESYISKIISERKLYEGTSYALPVLGTVNTITDLTRSQIVSYYKKYYVPNNMVGMIIGDFDTSSMVKKLKDYFGPYPPKAIPFTKRLKLKSLKNNNVYNIKGDVTKNYISLGIKGPAMDDPDYFPFVVLNMLLNDHTFIMSGETTNGNEKSTKKKTKTFNLDHIYNEYTANSDFGTLKFSAVVPKGADTNDVLHKILVNIKALSHNLSVLPEDIRGIKTRLKTEELFLKERMHYYGISKANMLVNGGYQFMDSYIDNIERVTLKQVKRVARKYLAVDTARFYKRTGEPDKVNYVATIVEPLGEKNVTFASKLDSHSLDKKGTLDATKDVDTKKIIKREVLPNGLTLITNKNDDSEVFAVHILLKNRSFLEPEGKTGIVDFLHRLLTKGTTTKSEKEIEKILRSIGARLTLSDDPFIPYDDYRTSPLFSFIRLETIDDFYADSLGLLADLILNPAFDSEKIKEVRRHMFSIIQTQKNSVVKTARKLFYETLFPETSLAKRFTGDVNTVSSISRDDLIKFHKEYFSPNNMIINIVSNISNEVLSEKIHDLFGGLEKNNDLKEPGPIKPKIVSGIEEINIKKNKEQSYIFMGYPIQHVEEADMASVSILSSLLSNDMAFRLREEQGLAYSIGCSIHTLDNLGWFESSIGTRKKNIEQAKSGIVEIINEYKTKEFDEVEVEKTINKLKGKMMMRRLPRINQAYYAGVYEFYRDDYEYDKKFLSQLSKVTPNDIKRVAKRYLQTNDYLWVVIE